jgi:hypothetical protein
MNARPIFAKLAGPLTAALTFLLAGSCSLTPAPARQVSGATGAPAVREPDRYPFAWETVPVSAEEMVGATLGPFGFESLHLLKTSRQGADLPETIGGISSILPPPLGMPADIAAFITDQGGIGVLGFPTFRGGAQMIAQASTLGPDGQPLVSEAERDSEGLAVMIRDGKPVYAISLERDHRILFYAGDLGWGGLFQPGTPGPRLTGTEGLQPNGGIEALEAIPDGRLLAIAEYGTSNDESRVPFWLVDPDASAPVAPAGRLAVADGYGVTEARLAHETIWLILRRWRVEEGTRVRLAACPLAGFVSGNPTCTVQASFEPPFPVDNFEAMTISPAPEGWGWIVRIMSDDNFEPAQRTLLLTLRLPG